MNPTHEDQKLDDMLQRWANKSTSAEHLTDLSDRIVVSVLESVPHMDTTKNSPDRRPVTLSRTNVVQRPTNQRRWASGFAMATVVSALLSVGFLLLQRQPPAPLPAAEMPPDYAWLQKNQIHDKTVLLAEMENLFDQQLTWLAETGDHIQFGLNDPSTAGSSRIDHGDRVAVRVVVERRAAGRSDWQPAWIMDVVSRSEEVVNIASQDHHGNELRLWTYRLPDGAIAVDSQVQLAGRDAFHAETSGLHQNGIPLKVATARNNEAEYRVYQTVTALDGTVI